MLLHHQREFFFLVGVIELFPNRKDSFANPFPITNPPDARIDYGKEIEFHNTRIVDANRSKSRCDLDSLEASERSLGYSNTTFSL